MKRRKRIILVIVLIIVVLAIYGYFQISRHVANVNESAAKIRELRQKVIDQSRNQ